MIANISPSVTSYEDTLNTLKYANRAKSIKTQTTKNVHETTTQDSVNNYQDMIKQLQLENQKLKQAIRDSKYPTLSLRC